MNNIWDTTTPVFKYPKNFRKVYETICISQRKSYSDWIGKISKTFNDEIDWWASSVASRNNYISNIFHYICILESLKSLEKKNKLPNKLIVDSYQLKKIIFIYFKEKIKVAKKIQTSNLIKKIYFVFYPLFFYFLIFLFSRIYKPQNTVEKNKSILIDTFVTSDDLNIDRYYNRLKYKKLNKKNNFFVPTILYISIFKLPKLIQNIRNNKNFILKEDFINFSDIIHSSFYIFRKKKFYIKYSNYKNWNLSSIIKEEFSKYANFQTVLVSILNYRFAQNLHSRNIKLKKVINWFENTSVDKGWNFGFRKFYPKISIIGYQGYTLYRQFICLHPSKAEYLYKVIPNKIIVIGKSYKKIRQEFCKNLKINIGPALRFNHLFSFKHKSNFEKKYNILVSLSIDNEVSKKILGDIINSKWCNSGKKIYVKSHPLVPLSKIIQRNEVPNNLIELKGNFFEIAKNSKIIISAGISSSILEGFACGCAILIPEVSKNDYQDFTYLKIPKASYKICKSVKELDKGIDHFINEKKRDEKKRIKKMYLLKSKLFEKTTQRNLNIFL